MTQGSHLCVYISEETQNTDSKEHVHPYVHRIIYNSQDIKATQLPINRQADRKAMVHIYNGVLLRHEKNKILPLVTAWMDLEGK